MDAIFVAIRTFFEAGGDVLFLIAGATFIMWALILSELCSLILSTNWMLVRR